MRFLVITLILLFSLATQAQQGFKLGLNGGLPINQEGNDAVSIVVGADVGYLFALGEVVDAGVMVGFINGFPGGIFPDLAFPILLLWGRPGLWGRDQ